MSDPAFTLHLSGGETLIYRPYSSRLEDEWGRLIDLSRVNGIYKEQKETFKDAHIISSANPGRKVRALKSVKIQMGLRCNYACTYCIQAVGRVVERGRTPGDADAFAAKIIGLIEDAAPDGEDLRFEFWGGEPFLYWDIFRTLAEALRKAYPKALFNTVTNGSLLDDEKVDWLDRMGFILAVSHDGPGYHLRGPDPLDDPEKLRVIRRLYHRLAPQNRIGFNSVLTLPNHSIAAIMDHLSERMEVDRVFLTTEGFPTPYETNLMWLIPQTDEEKRQVWRSLIRDITDERVMHTMGTMLGALETFFRRLERGVPLTALGQRCADYRPDVLAVDLDGNVLTCHVVSAMDGHCAGHMDDLDGVRVSRATHWRLRDGCSACPVISFCEGACMAAQEGRDWTLTCEGRFVFFLALLAAAIYFATGQNLVAIEGARIRHDGVTRLAI